MIEHQTLHNVDSREVIDVGEDDEEDEEGEFQLHFEENGENVIFTIFFKI